MKQLTNIENRICIGLIFIAQHRLCAMPYSWLNDELSLGLNLNDYRDRVTLLTWLENISLYEILNDRPPLSVLAVDDSTELPSDGFFKLLKLLGEYVPCVEAVKDMIRVGEYEFQTRNYWRYLDGWSWNGYAKDYGYELTYDPRSYRFVDRQVI